MQDCIYHMTLKSHCISEFSGAISALENATFLWTSMHNVTTYLHI